MVQQRYDGTSNATTLTITVPVPVVSITNYATWGMCGYSKDNGSALTSPASWLIETGSNVITLYTNAATGAWTNSGAKRTRFLANYEI